MGWCGWRLDHGLRHRKTCHLILSQISDPRDPRVDGPVRPAGARQLAGYLSIVQRFLVGALGTGLLVDDRGTRQIALQAAMLLAFLPTFMLSGFIFPISSMPVALQYITTVVPAKYFLVALRGVVLKGLGLRALWQPFGALVAYAIVVLGLSAARLARR